MQDEWSEGETDIYKKKDEEDKVEGRKDIGTFEHVTDLNGAFRYWGTRSRDRQRGKGPYTP